jgi:hypothetical protein
MAKTEKAFGARTVKRLCAKAVWDYIKDNSAWRGTDFYDGVSTDIKSHKDVNIDAWFKKVTANLPSEVTNGIPVLTKEEEAELKPMRRDPLPKVEVEE